MKSITRRRDSAAFRRALRQTGFTRRQAAEYLGVTVSEIRDFERGKIQQSARLLQRLHNKASHDYHRYGGTWRNQWVAPL